MKWQDGQDRQSGGEQESAAHSELEHLEAPVSDTAPVPAPLESSGSVGLPPGLLRRLRAHIVTRGAQASSPTHPDPAMLAAFASGDWRERASAVQSLSLLDEHAPLDLLAHALDDEHEMVRAAAARAMGRLSVRAPLGHLLHALHDSSWHVRAAAAQSLGKLGKRVPAGPLIKLLGDEDESVRAAATGALGEIGDSSAIKALQIALQDQAWHVREMAVLALGQFGLQAPTLDLVLALQDREPLVREAVESLHESQPELFHSIISTRRSFTSPSATGVRVDGAQSGFAAGRWLLMHSGLPMIGPLARRHYPRRGVTRSLRQWLLYGWCIFMGYLGWCSWYLYQYARPEQSIDLSTFFSIITMTTLPFSKPVPAWVHTILGGCMMVVLFGALWATLDIWQEQYIRRVRRARYEATPEKNEALLKQEYGQPENEGEYVFPEPPYQIEQTRRIPSKRTILISLLTITLICNAITWALLLQRQSTLESAASAFKRVPLFSTEITGGAIGLAWSPDSTRIVTGGIEGKVQVWSALSHNLLLTHIQRQVVYAVAWSPDGRVIASGSSDGSIQLWSAETGTTLMGYYGHTASVMDIAWSPDGTRIISSAEDGSVQVWDTLTGRTRAKYLGNRRDSASVAWSPDGGYIVAAGLNDELWVRDARTEKLIYKQPLSIKNKGLLSGVGHSVAWSPLAQSPMLAYSDRQNIVHLVRVPDGKLVDTYTEPERQRVDPVNKKYPSITAGSIAWSPNGSRLATTRLDKTIAVRSTLTGEVIFQCTGYAGYFYSAAWSPDGQYLAATSWGEPTLLIWKAV